jgi:2-polyprenyl-3-methyl-5-hydroxy-6-metoxy-1,4-benzoquinol methylase
MSRVAEYLLYYAARALYRSEVAHDRGMKLALTSQSCNSAYRSRQLEKVLEPATRYGIDLSDKEMLDLGCSDGAITEGYLESGAVRVFGVDLDDTAIRRARTRERPGKLSFHLSGPSSIPLEDLSVDVIVCYDVFEHIAKPEAVLAECLRILRPAGKMLIGTWGWHHPFAPHLWSTMPVPWAHVLVSERTLLRACRRVYNSPWYEPTMHDLDEKGYKILGKYEEDCISTDYLNKCKISDFEMLLSRSGFDYRIHLQPFGSRYARWTGPLLRVRFLREYLASYLWMVLAKPGTPASAGPQMEEDVRGSEPAHSGFGVSQDEVPVAVASQVEAEQQATTPRRTGGE